MKINWKELNGAGRIVRPFVWIVYVCLSALTQYFDAVCDVNSIFAFCQYGYTVEPLLLQPNRMLSVFNSLRNKIMGRRTTAIDLQLNLRQMKIQHFSNLNRNNMNLFAIKRNHKEFHECNFTLHHLSHERRKLISIYRHSRYRK